MNFPNSDIHQIRDGFDEALYLGENPDVADAVRRGHFDSGLAHFVKYGHRENRSGGPDPVNPPALRSRRSYRRGSRESACMGAQYGVRYRGGANKQFIEVYTR